ncbi:MAG: DUF5050 domain-containing protein [Clostridiales bacterium]|jgi:hypothetical protein|nr:DUF5050 domain-containing protein [Clostridiales bacterium]
MFPKAFRAMLVAFLLFFSMCACKGARGSAEADADNSELIGTSEEIQEDIESSEPESSEPAITENNDADSAQSPAISEIPLREGNAVNNSVVALGGGCLFYAKPVRSKHVFHQGALTKLDLISNEETILKVGDLQEFINYSDGWVYFATTVSTDARHYNIYRIRDTGEDEEIVTTFESESELDEAQKILLVDDFIYCSFLSLLDGLNGIYKVSAKTGAITQLSEAGTVSMAILDDWIYYTLGQDGRSIQKMRLDGSEKTKINDENSTWINIYEDRIYYANETDRQIVSCDLNGKDRILLKDGTGWCRSLIVYDDNIYYSVSGDGVYKMDLDGNSATKLCDYMNNFINYTDMGAANDLLYFMDSREDDDSTAPYPVLYSIGLDGENLTELSHLFEETGAAE